MIRRNVAGQGPYKFPQLINLSGAFVTSGASVEVTKDGSKAAATNAPSHDTNGRWSWSPSQAETDCATMIAELIGADGSSVVLNFVTTAADTSAVALGANTTTPPTAAANATAVWAESLSGSAASVWLTRLTSAFTTLVTNLTAMITGGGGTAAFTETALENGSGGDATEANQEAILAAIQGANVVQVASPNVYGNLVLTQGDTYDGVGNPKAQWSVTTDYTSGWTVTFTIRDEEDNVVYTTAGAVASATLVTVDIDAPTGLTMAGCPGSWKGKFDVQMSKAGSVQTIAIGACYINEDQTR